MSYFQNKWRTVLLYSLFVLSPQGKKSVLREPPLGTS